MVPEWSWYDADMSRQRVIKQASYAGAFLGVLLLLLGGCTVLVSSPQRNVVPTPSPTPLFQSLVVTPTVDVIRHGENMDLVATVHNPNPRAGVKEYPVTFVITDNQGKATRHREVTYLLPGSLQYVVALRLPAVENFTVTLEVPEQPEFAILPDNLPLPVFGGPFLRSLPTRKEIGDAVVEEQKGVVRNNGTFDFQRVELVALASDAEGRVVGVGKTFIGELRVGEQREFTVQWPVPASPTAKVITSLSTNIFLDEAIIRIIGDPSTLR